MAGQIGQALFNERSLAAAATCDIGSGDEWFIELTGTGGPITSFSNMAKKMRFLRFSGAAQVNHGSAIVTNIGANRVAAAGDRAIVIGLSTGDVLFTWLRIDGKAVVGPAAADISDASSAGRNMLTAANVAAQQTLLGLMSAAYAAIGTSGDTVPKNNSVNIFSTIQSIAHALDTNALSLTLTNASLSDTVIRTQTTRAANSGFQHIMCRTDAGSNISFYVRGDGEAYADGAFNGGGADYAEYFEWADGNAQGEDRRGVAVALIDGKIAPAKPGDDPIGVVSVNPTVVGDAGALTWGGKFLRDDFGSFIMEDYEVVSWVERVQIRRARPAVKVGGKTVTPAVPGGYRDEERAYAADAIPAGVKIPNNARRTVQQRRKINPAFDAARDYTPRERRQEWAAIGMVGKVRLRKGQPVRPHWIKLRDIGKAVEEWLIPSG